MKLFFLSKLGRWIDVVLFFCYFLFLSFDALEPGVVVTKERSDSVRTRFQLMRNADILPPIDGLPVQAPPGLDTARQTICFEKIRELSCIKVKGRTETGSPNIYSLVHAWFGRTSSSLGASSQSSVVSAVPLWTFTWLSPNIKCFILLLSHFTPDCMHIITSTITSITHIVIVHTAYYFVLSLQALTLLTIWLYYLHLQRPIHLARCGWGL
jgi:hypothetical protein